MVRVVEANHRQEPCFLVLYRDAMGRRRTAKFPRTRAGRIEALAHADGVWAGMQEPTGEILPITMRALFDAYAAETFGALRPKSQQLYRDSWHHLEHHVGGHTAAHLCTRDTMVELRRKLEDPKREPKPLGVTTLQHMFSNLRVVFRWAEDAGKIPTSSVLRYVFRIAKDKRPAPRAEYRTEEWEKIVGVLRSWRPKLAILVIGGQGVRQVAALHLRWEDLDWTADEVTWRSQWDKQGNEWRQPMREKVRAALEARWQDAGRPATGWVFPAPRGKTECYTIQSLWRALKGAEERAGVERMVGRGGHGFRKMLAGDVAAMTGNLKTAMDSIGDKDIRQAETYLRPRQDHIRQAFKDLDAQKEAVEG